MYTTSGGGVEGLDLIQSTRKGIGGIDSVEVGSLRHEARERKCDRETRG